MSELTAKQKEETKLSSGLVVVDVQGAEIVRFFDPAVVRANCGLALSGDGEKMYANWGGNVATDAEGEW